jgi:hypothetical protein
MDGKHDSICGNIAAVVEVFNEKISGEMSTGNDVLFVSGESIPVQ